MMLLKKKICYKFFFIFIALLLCVSVFSVLKTYAYPGGDEQQPRHECKFCQKCFRSKKSLTNHIRVHTGQMLYFCGCGKYYKQRSHFVTHIKQIHKTGPLQHDKCNKSLLPDSDFRQHEYTPDRREKTDTNTQKQDENMDKLMSFWPKFLSAIINNSLTADNVMHRGSDGYTINILNGIEEAVIPIKELLYRLHSAITGEKKSVEIDEIFESLECIAQDVSLLAPLNEQSLTYLQQFITESLDHFLNVFKVWQSALLQHKKIISSDEVYLRFSAFLGEQIVILSSRIKLQQAGPCTLPFNFESSDYNKKDKQESKQIWYSLGERLASEAIAVWSTFW